MYVDYLRENLEQYEGNAAGYTLFESVTVTVQWDVINCMWIWVHVLGDVSTHCKYLWDYGYLFIILLHFGHLQFLFIEIFKYLLVSLFLKIAIKYIIYM